MKQLFYASLVGLVTATSCTQSSEKKPSPDPQENEVNTAEVMVSSSEEDVTFRGKEETTLVKKDDFLAMLRSEIGLSDLQSQDQNARIELSGVALALESKGSAGLSLRREVLGIEAKLSPVLSRINDLQANIALADASLATNPNQPVVSAQRQSDRNALASQIALRDSYNLDKAKAETEVSKLEGETDTLTASKADLEAKLASLAPKIAAAEETFAAEKAKFFSLVSAQEKPLSEYEATLPWLKKIFVALYR